MLNRKIIAQDLINKFNFETYLEIGVQRGRNFFAVQAKRKIAVDPAFMFSLTNRLKHAVSFLKDHYHEMTSDAFFDQHAPRLLQKKPLDVALIDGLHTYDQVMADFKNCLEYLSPKGYILFHDCNPTSEEAAAYGHSPDEIAARFPGKNKEWNGDVWKAIVHIRSHYPDIEIFVVDADYGVGVARRKVGGNDLLSLTENQIRELTYEDLNRNRAEYLNLKTENFWNDYLKNS